MKYLLTALALIFVFLPQTVNAESAESAEDFYLRQYRESGADTLGDTLPEEVREYLEEIGLDPANGAATVSLSAESVFSHIIGIFKGGLKAPLSGAAAITAVILISAALGSAELNSSAARAAVYAAAAAALAAVVQPIYSVIISGADAIKGISTFMLSFVPVFAAIAAASGATATATATSGLLLSAAEGLSYISGFAVLPLMNAYLAIGISASASPLLRRSGIAEAIKKLALWLIALVSTVFAGILAIQTAIGSAADSLTSKTARFIIGSSVPVAGGVLSEALGTVTASMSLLRSSVGIYGVAACAALLLPYIAELLLWRAALLVTCALTEIFSSPRIGSLLKTFDSVLSVMLGIILTVGAMFIISLATVVSFAKSA